MDIQKLQQQIDALIEQGFSVYISVYPKSEVHVSLNKTKDGAELSARAFGKTVDEAAAAAVAKFPKGLD